MSEESIVREDFEISFDKAAKYVKNNSNLFENDHKLKLYGLYKLSTVGKCNICRPGGLLNWERKEMWDNWNSLSEKNIKNPKKMYVDYLTSLVDDWDNQM
tara:strand:+ start:441 stop:740 length:300 start_codon:yes stop_codon:yes gene_type:complete